MSDINITIPGGTSKRLLTEGKRCNKNIVVTADGGDSYYDVFWDDYQANGNRTDYTYAFAGFGWTDETFKPKYDIKPVTNIQHIFSSCLIEDVVRSLTNCGVIFDSSQCSGTGYVMQGNSVTQTLPMIDTRARKDINYFLSDCRSLRYVEKVILKSDGSQKFNTFSFATLPALEEIHFEGIIGNSLEIKGSSILSTTSVQSVIDCLKDLTGATAQTLTFHSDVKANMTEEQIQDVYNKNWILG